MPGKLISLLLAILLALSACGAAAEGEIETVGSLAPAAIEPSLAKAKPETSGQAEISLEDLMDSICGAALGNRDEQAKAAGMLLDIAAGLTMESYAQLDAAAWAEAFEPEEDAVDVAWAWAGVLDIAAALRTGEEQALAWLEESGYVPLRQDRWEHAAQAFRWLASDFSVLFTRLMEQKADIRDTLVNDYESVSLERLEGIWFSVEQNELLVIYGDRCRVVIPYLGYYGEDAYAVRVRDRSDLGYCPALEIDFRESGDFTAPLTYYVSGADEGHFWSLTTRQMFGRLG